MHRYILIVERERHLACLFEGSLQPAGVEVSIAHDGQEALEIVKTRRPDLVILGRSVPGKAQFLKDLKEDPQVTGQPEVMDPGHKVEDMQRLLDILIDRMKDVHSQPPHPFLLPGSYSHSFFLPPSASGKMPDQRRVAWHVILLAILSLALLALLYCLMSFRQVGSGL